MRRKPDPYRRDARRPYHIPRKGWRQVVGRVSNESSRDNLSVIAAGCAFYVLFAIFPGLSALNSLYGLTADPTAIEQQVGGFASGRQPRPIISSSAKFTALPKPPAGCSAGALSSVSLFRFGV